MKFLYLFSIYLLLESYKVNCIQSYRMAIRANEIFSDDYEDICEQYTENGLFTLQMTIYLNVDFILCDGQLRLEYREPACLKPLSKVIQIQYLYVSNYNSLSPYQIILKDVNTFESQKNSIKPKYTLSCSITHGIGEDHFIDVSLDVKGDVFNYISKLLPWMGADPEAHKKKTENANKADTSRTERGLIKADMEKTDYSLILLDYNPSHEVERSQDHFNYLRNNFPNLTNICKEGQAVEEVIICYEGVIKEDSSNAKAFRLLGKAYMTQWYKYKNINDKQIAGLALTNAIIAYEIAIEIDPRMMPLFKLSEDNDNIDEIELYYEALKYLKDRLKDYKFYYLMALRQLRRTNEVLKHFLEEHINIEGGQLKCVLGNVFYDLNKYNIASDLFKGCLSWSFINSPKLFSITLSKYIICLSKTDQLFADNNEDFISKYIHNSHFLSNYHLANEYFKKKDYINAEIFYKNEIKINKYFYPAYNMLAMTYIYKKPQQYSRAVQVFDYSILIEKHYLPYYYKASCLFEINRKDEALVALKTSQLLNPNKFINLEFFKNYWNSGDYIKAIDYLRQARTYEFQHNEDEIYHSCKNKVGVFSFDVEKADPEIDNIIKDKNELGKAIKSLSEKYNKISEFFLFLSKHDKILQLRDTIKVLTALGDLYRFSEKFDDALIKYEEAIDLIEKDEFLCVAKCSDAKTENICQPLFSKMIALFKTMQYDEADLIADKLITKNFKTALIWHYKCFAWIKRDNFFKAIEACNTSIILNPFDTAAYLTKTKLLFSHGDIYQGMESLNALIRLTGEDKYIDLKLKQFDIINKMNESIELIKGFVNKKLMKYYYTDIKNLISLGMYKYTYNLFNNLLFKRIRSARQAVKTYSGKNTSGLSKSDKQIVKNKNISILKALNGKAKKKNSDDDAFARLFILAGNKLLSIKRTELALDYFALAVQLNTFQISKELRHSILKIVDEKMTKNDNFNKNHIILINMLGRLDKNRKD
jgi:tetratricopeptide (TPR) repeat protein